MKSSQGIGEFNYSIKNVFIYTKLIKIHHFNLNHFVLILKEKRSWLNEKF